MSMPNNNPALEAFSEMDTPVLRDYPFFCGNPFFYDLKRKQKCFPCFFMCNISFMADEHLNYLQPIWTVKGQRASKDQPTFGDGESWRPLWSQNVKTNAAVAVDIWVVDSCGKRNLKTEKRCEAVKITGRQEEQDTERHKALVRLKMKDIMSLTVTLSMLLLRVFVCINVGLTFGGLKG